MHEHGPRQQQIRGPNIAHMSFALPREQTSKYSLRRETGNCWHHCFQLDCVDGLSDVRFVTSCTSYFIETEAAQSSSAWNWSTLIWQAMTCIESNIWVVCRTLSQWTARRQTRRSWPGPYMKRSDHLYRSIWDILCTSACTWKNQCIRSLCLLGSVLWCASCSSSLPPNRRVAAFVNMTCESIINLCCSSQNPF